MTSRAPCGAARPKHEIIMAFTPITPPPRFRLSDAVVDQLEKMMVDGNLLPGEALPSERDLAQQLGVSRPSLREALLKLESRGLLCGRPAGGYLVANATMPLVTDALAHLMARHTKAAGDIIELREGLESMAVQLAALRATKGDLTKLKEALEALEHAFDEFDPATFNAALPSLDARFHLALAEATHNVVLTHMMHAIFNLVTTSIEENYFLFRKRGADLSHLVMQHRKIYDAVAAHDAQAGLQALMTHLTFVKRNAGR